MVPDTTPWQQAEISDSLGGGWPALKLRGWRDLEKTFYKVCFSYYRFLIMVWITNT